MNNENIDKKIVVTGILGQVGSYIAELYLSKGFTVIGIHRRSSTPFLDNIKGIIEHKNFTLREGDITDSTSMNIIVNEYKPYIFINMAAQSHVGSSYSQPIISAVTNYLGVANILEAIRINSPKTRFWNSCTSERYGNNPAEIQDELTHPCPVSPYAAAKVGNELLIDSYKLTYGMYCCYGILFNIESKNRSKAFFTRKVSSWLGNSLDKVRNTIIKELSKDSYISISDAFKYCIDKNIIKKLQLGNLETSRSWTHVSDTIEAIYRQLELPEPDNFVIGREETHTLKEFLTEAFNCVGIDDWTSFVEINREFIRPSDVKLLKPTCTKAKNILRWEPKVSFKELVAEMVNNDIKLNRSII